jgi:hypothetical protein
MHVHAEGPVRRAFPERIDKSGMTVDWFGWERVTAAGLPGTRGMEGREAARELTSHPRQRRRSLPATGHFRISAAFVFSAR